MELKSGPEWSGIVEWSGVVCKLKVLNIRSTEETAEVKEGEGTSYCFVGPSRNSVVQ